MTVETSPRPTPLVIRLHIGTASRFENVAGLWRTDMQPRIHTLEQLKEYGREVEFFESLRGASIQAALKGKPFSLSLSSDPGKSVTLRFEDQETTIAWQGCGIFLARVFAPDLLHPIEETKREAGQGVAIAEALHQGQSVELQFR